MKRSPFPTRSSRLGAQSMDFSSLPVLQRGKGPSIGPYFCKEVVLGHYEEDAAAKTNVAARSALLTGLTPTCKDAFGNVLLSSPGLIFRQSSEKFLSQNTSH